MDFAVRKKKKKSYVCNFFELELQSESSGREPENGKFPKVVRKGCKRSFEPRERKWGCTSAKWGCIGAKRGAKDS